MVDAIKSTVNRLETAKGSPTESRLAQNAGGKAVSALADTVKVSSAASSKAYQQLAEAPPIDNEAVRRIKDAIAQGKYPVDVDLISEALMDAYRGIKA